MAGAGAVNQGGAKMQGCVTVIRIADVLGGVLCGVSCVVGVDFVV